jgi:LemA protein
MSASLILLIVLIVAIFAVILMYNRLVALRQTVNQAWGDIDVQLKQRHDLVPNLVETVKGYATHERGTFEAVISARNAAMAAGDAKDQARAESQLTSALRQVFALAEAYPDLKANTNFLHLQRELADLENKIAASRRFFNNAVAEYNTAQDQFPAALFAHQLGFQKHEFFAVSAADRAAVEAPPTVSFR